MPPQSNLNFQQLRARELEHLAEILNRNGICSDTGPLYRAASGCKALSGDEWSYDLERLVFKPIYVGRTIPSRVSDLSLVLIISASGLCGSDSEVCDPFRSLEFNIIISARRNDGSGDKVTCAWHLDKDEPALEDGTQEFIHPCYHFQHGGKYIREDDHDHGASLILESPRLAHPPMDAVLGIDFILTNYYRYSEIEFRNEHEYLSLLVSAQTRIWRPYAQAVANHWDPLINNNVWSAIRLWPQLIS